MIYSFNRFYEDNRVFISFFGKIKDGESLNCDYEANIDRAHNLITENQSKAFNFTKEILKELHSSSIQSKELSVREDQSLIELSDSKEVNSMMGTAKKLALKIK